MKILDLEKVITDISVLSIFSKDKNGLTISEASHIMNVVKEKCKRLEDKLKTLTYFNETFVVDGVDYPHVSGEFDKNCPNIIREIGNYYKLSTYLGEAISIKEKFIQTVENSHLKSSLNAPIFPTKKVVDTSFKTWLNQQPVNKISEYYELESINTHLGKKFLHNYDEIRNNFINTKLSDVIDKKSKIIVIKRTQNVTNDELDEIYFDLQHEYRENQKILNSFYASHKVWEKKVNDDIDNEFKSLINEYRDLNLKYVSDLKDEENNFDILKRDVLSELASYRIVIPKSYEQDIERIRENK